jgi:hypothetical protein
MKQALENFQRRRRDQNKDQNSEILSAAYDDTMERIKGQKIGFRRLAEKALSWLCHAKRQLTAKELQHALALDMEIDNGNIPQKFDTDNNPEVDLIVSACCGLVAADEKGHVVRLVHYTTQEYFDRMRKQWFPEAEDKIANVCVVCLQFDAYGSRVDPITWILDYKTAEESLVPLYTYACVNWGYHAREVHTLGQMIHDFLANEERVSYATRIMFKKIKRDSPSFLAHYRIKMTKLDLAAFFGVTSLVRELLNIPNDRLEARNYDQALLCAAMNGQGAAVRLL